MQPHVSVHVTLHWTWLSFWALPWVVFKRNVSETRSVSIIRCEGRKSRTQLSPLGVANHHQCLRWTKTGSPPPPTQNFLSTEEQPVTSLTNSRSIRFRTLLLNAAWRRIPDTDIHGPWRPIGLWGVDAPTFSRQSAHRWRWGCQLYAPAALYHQEDSWYSFLLEAEWTPGSQCGLEGLGQLKNPMTSSGMEPATFAVTHAVRSWKGGIETTNSSGGSCSPHIGTQLF
jgi:hypothetical protein